MAGRTGRSRPRRGGWFLPSLHFTRLRRGEKKERRRPPSSPPPPPLLLLSSASILSLLLLEELARRGATTGEWGWRAAWDYSAVDTLRITEIACEIFRYRYPSLFLS